MGLRLRALCLWNSVIFLPFISHFPVFIFFFFIPSSTRIIIAGSLRSRFFCQPHGLPHTHGLAPWRTHPSTRRPWKLLARAGKNGGWLVWCEDHASTTTDTVSATGRQCVGAIASLAVLLRYCTAPPLTEPLILGCMRRLMCRPMHLVEASAQQSKARRWRRPQPDKSRSKIGFSQEIRARPPRCYQKAS